MPSIWSPIVLRTSSSVRSPGPMILMPEAASPRSANCLAKIPAWVPGKYRNAVSGLRSRTRCRNGAKSGFASGMRIDFDDLPTELGEALLECCFRLGARPPLVDERDDPLAAVLCRPLPHDPGRLREDEAGANVIRRDRRGYRCARNHHNRRDLCLSGELPIAEAGRRDPASENVDLVVDDHLLDDAARVIRNPGIIAENPLQLFARDHIPVLLHIEPCSGRSLPSGR